jgi:hypothetical protein
MGQFLNFLIAGSLLQAILLVPQQVLAQQWRPVRGGILFGISGMALVQQQSNSLNLLLVHDNKGKDEARVAIITIKGQAQPEYFPLNWPSNTALPGDLEALTSVPGETNSFMALSSVGTIYYIKLNAANKTISVIKVFNLPDIPKNSNFEGFALQKIDETLLAVWAHRGQGEEPAKVYWGKLDLANYKIDPIGSSTLKVPLPIGNNVRHVSDLKMDKSGVLFITAATDPGNDGPFESAVYILGVFGMNRDGLAKSATAIAFRQNPALVPLYHYDYHKIEAIELIPGAAGGVIFATDDENMGSSVYIP